MRWILYPRGVQILRVSRIHRVNFRMAKERVKAVECEVDGAADQCEVSVSPLIKAGS